MNFSKIGIATAVALLVSGPASAGFIDFENGPALGLGDNDSLTTEYQGTDGVRFEGAFLEASGEEDANPQGFLTDQTGGFDDAFDATPGLGDWFVRTGGEVSERGGQSVFLSIFYDSAVTAASGQIWDIDGNNSQGSEQWDVRAFDSDNNLVTSALSPEGTTNGPGSLDGLPWTFYLTGGEFSRIDFVFTGTKETGVGLGFDNFNTASVPAPGTLALLGLGLFGIAAARRRKV